MSLDQLRVGLLGTWRSIAPEVRPSRNPDGTIKPFFQERRFVYQENDRFAVASRPGAGDVRERRP